MIKVKKVKARMEHACSAKPSPEQIKVKKRPYRRQEKRKRHEGSLSLSVDGSTQRKMARRTTGCHEQIVHMAPRNSVYAQGVMWANCSSTFRREGSSKMNVQYLYYQSKVWIHFFLQWVFFIFIVFNIIY